MSDDKKVIFSMSGVTKTFKTANTPVLKDIYLSFFYGAKIGILGLNGSGKSTLLKIIAGVDKNFQGDVVFSPGYNVGYLEQEPELDESKKVLEVVKEGVSGTRAPHLRCRNRCPPRARWRGCGARRLSSHRWRQRWRRHSRWPRG